MGLGQARRVAVLAAMVPELRPLVRALQLAPATLGGVAAHRGRAGTREVAAAVTTMGTRAARDVTRRVLDAAEVEHVIVIGVCGAIDPRLAIGALIAPMEVRDEASGATYRPLALDAAPRSGVLLTTDVLHSDPATIARLAADGVLAVDMETAAIAAACAARGVPWSVYRAISDRAGDPEVDTELLAMTRPDGTASPSAVLRFVARHPRRIPKLVRLGRGLHAAVQQTTAATLAALRAP